MGGPTLGSNATASWLLFNKTQDEDLLFTTLFDHGCLLGMGHHGTYMEEARLFFKSYMRDLRTDSTCLSILHFICMVAMTQSGKIPSPEQGMGFAVFHVYLGLQFLQLVLQFLGIIMVVLSYLSLHSNLGECLVQFRNDGVPGIAMLDVVTALTNLALPALTQKLLVIELTFLNVIQGVRAVQYNRLGRFLAFLKSCVDWFLFADTALVLSLSVMISLWAATVSFMVLVVPIVTCVVPLLVVVAAPLLLKHTDAQYERCKKYCTTKKWENNKEAEAEEETDGASETEPIEERRKKEAERKAKEMERTAILLWIDQRPDTLSQLTSSLKVPIVSGGFVYSALIWVAVAPVLFTTTWWACIVCEGFRHRSQLFKMLGILLQVVLLSWCQGIVFPSIADLHQLGSAVQSVFALDIGTFLGILESLYSFEFVFPSKLLRQSRLLSLIADLVATLKWMISLVQYFLERCEVGGYWQGVPIWKGATGRELLRAGYTMPETLATGISIDRLRAEQITMEEFSQAGISPDELRSLGFDAFELKNSGFGVGDLRKAGFRASELREAGFASVVELRGAGCDAKELKEAGFSARDLKTAGFKNVRELKDAGFDPKEIKEAGYGTIRELIKSIR